MTARTTTGCTPGGVCITCSDQGVEMRVIHLGEDGVAICTDPDDQAAEVEIGLVDGVLPGDTVLVHAGVAIARLGEARSA